MERPTINIDRFEPASDILIWELAPMRPIPDVTLMIKACAMEAETLEAQVRHLIRQLEKPHPFTERILVIDPRTEGFPREYTKGNIDALRAAAKRLLESGWLDRIVEGPADGPEVAAINQQWFSLQTPHGHLENGTQITSTLAGFNAC
ncbi:MAG: hypothetical protein QXU75_09445, partial [Candidatus Methanomethylicaceae archaeon]